MVGNCLTFHSLGASFTKSCEAVAEAVVPVLKDLEQTTLVQLWTPSNQFTHPKPQARRQSQLKLDFRWVFGGILFCQFCF
eukprot:3878589-Amphidinium_carterae.2